MDRRSFISMLAGAAGATLVPWRGLATPAIFLPPRHICRSWCTHGPFKSRTAEDIFADVQRTLSRLTGCPVPDYVVTVTGAVFGTIEPGMLIYDGHRVLGHIQRLEYAS